MAEVRDLCLVLWADRFDEAVAVVFAVELRRVGLPVQLVKLPGISYTGMYGMTLTPDISLNDALTMLARVACIIIPSDSPALRRAANDPRVGELLQLAAQQRIEIIASSQASTIFTGFNPGDEIEFSPYSQGLALYRQAHELARRVGT